MKVLVTGGGGFLGRAIVRRLLARESSVVILGRSDHPDLSALGVRVVRGDVSRMEDVVRAASGCEAVFHVAAKAGVWGKREDYEATNVVGTRNVLEACRREGITRLVHTSTPSVVFNGRDLRGVDESVPLGQRFPCHYARTKAAAERLALAASDPKVLRVCALRPHLIWGVGDPHLLPRVVARARAGRLRIVGRGQNKVDLTHVDNAAAAHLLALDALASGAAEGKTYFISDGNPVLLWPWINQMLQLIGLPPVRRSVPLPVAWGAGALAECVWMALRLGGEPPMTRFVAQELAKDHFFSIEAARRDLGYAPTVDLERALRLWIDSQESL